MAHSEELKAQVWAALAIDKPADVAKAFGLPLGTVKRWAQERKPQDLLVTAEPEVLSRIDLDRSLKKARVVELAWDYLAANLAAQVAQAKVASEPDYLRKQPAGELAILHGVLNDKSVRLLAALHNPEERD